MGAWLHCLSSSGRLSPNLVFAAAGAVALVLVLLTLLAFLLLGGETRLVARLFRAFAGQRLIRRFIAGTMFDLIILFGNGAEVGVSGSLSIAGNIWGPSAGRCASEHIDRARRRSAL